MITCSECSKPISASAKSCPNCGSTSHRTKVWPWLLGVPLVLLVLTLIYGSSIPEYQTQAREVREMCEKIAPFQRDVCRSNYDRAIAEGRSKSAPPPPPYVPTPEELKKRAAQDSGLKESQIRECEANLPAKVAVYRRKMAAGEYWSAAQALQVCANVTDDQRTKDLVADAEVKEYSRSIELPTTPKSDRIRMITTLLRDYPKYGAKYQKLLARLQHEEGK